MKNNNYDEIGDSKAGGGMNDLINFHYEGDLPNTKKRFQFTFLTQFK